MCSEFRPPTSDWSRKRDAVRLRLSVGGEVAVPLQLSSIVRL